MARAALRISAAELARGSGVSERTIWRIEQVSGVPMNVTVESLERIRVYFEVHGIMFLPQEPGSQFSGPGVRIRP
jgi:transcriptional regulator with XRE-family HTH domain